jgi:hypothetical protein
VAKKAELQNNMFNEFLSEFQDINMHNTNLNSEVKQEEVILSGVNVKGQWSVVLLGCISVD